MKHLSIFAACLLCSCATLQSWQAKPAVQFAESEAIKIAAAYFSNGGSTDAAWGISQGLSLLGDTALFATQQKLANPSQAAANTVKQAVKDFSGNPSAVSGLANQLGNLVLRAAPQSTPSTKAAVVQAIARGVEVATANQSIGP